MGENKIDSADYGNMEGTITDFSVNPQSPDNAANQKETRYTNTNFSQQFGYYKKIPELKSAIDAKARWTVGKGYKADEETKKELDGIKGFGKDTFNTVLKNSIIISEVGGDSFAEKMRKKDKLLNRAKRLVGIKIKDGQVRDSSGKLINLKPLNPEKMITVANAKGLIIRYEQESGSKEIKNQTWNPEDIFHLSRDRVADEIHGVSVIDAVEETILMRNEAMADYKKLLHRNVFPIIKWQLDTDDTTKVAAFKAKADKAHTQGENLYIPKGAVDADVLAVPGNNMLNPLPWIEQLTNNFYQEVGTPQIIVGGTGDMTEATSKIAYFAWEQTIEDKQLYVEEQVWTQLGVKINLEFPASLQEDLKADKEKSETMQAATPEDTSVPKPNLTKK